MTLHGFGDSITYGSGASNLSKSYFGLLTAALGVPAVDHGVSTQMAMDGYDQVIATTINAGDLCTVMWGTNDEACYGTDTTKRGYYVDAMRSILVRLASGWLPASSATPTGAWADPGYGRGMLGANVPGAKMSFVASGSHVVIGTLRQLNNSSTFRVKVAGVDKGIFSTGGDVTTLLGRPFGPCGLAFATNPGDTVEVSVVTADANNPVYFHWYSNCVSRAKVVANNTPNFVGTLTGQIAGGTLANVAIYNTALATLVSEVAGFGLDVHLGDINAVLSPADMADPVHPGDSGHAKIEAVDYPLLATPHTFTPATLQFRDDGQLVATGGGFTKIIA